MGAGWAGSTETIALAVFASSRGVPTSLYRIANNESNVDTRYEIGSPANIKSETVAHGVNRIRDRG